MCKFFFVHRVTPFYKYHLNLCLCQGLSLFKKEPLFSPFDLTPQTTEICLPPGHCFETVHIKVSKIHLVARNSFISVFDIPQPCSQSSLSSQVPGPPPPIPPTCSSFSFHTIFPFHLFILSLGETTHT